MHPAASGKEPGPTGTSRTERYVQLTQLTGVALAPRPAYCQTVMPATRPTTPTIPWKKSCSYSHFADGDTETTATCPGAHSWPVMEPQPGRVQSLNPTRAGVGWKDGRPGDGREGEGRAGSCTCGWTAPAPHASTPTPLCPSWCPWPAPAYLVPPSPPRGRASLAISPGPSGTTERGVISSRTFSPLNILAQVTKPPLRSRRLSLDKATSQRHPAQCTSCFPSMSDSAAPGHQSQRVQAPWPLSGHTPAFCLAEVPAPALRAKPKAGTCQDLPYRERVPGAICPNQVEALPF